MESPPRFWNTVYNFEVVEFSVVILAVTKPRKTRTNDERTILIYNLTKFPCLPSDAKAINPSHEEFYMYILNLFGKTDEQITKKE